MYEWRIWTISIFRHVFCCLSKRIFFWQIMVSMSVPQNLLWKTRNFSFRLAAKGYRLEFHPELVVWTSVHDTHHRQYFQRKILKWVLEDGTAGVYFPKKHFPDSHTPAVAAAGKYLAAIGGWFYRNRIGMEPGFLANSIFIVIIFRIRFTFMFWAPNLNSI